MNTENIPLVKTPASDFWQWDKKEKKYSVWWETVIQPEELRICLGF